MELLYLFERIRIPVLNEFMLLVTQFGEETAFLVTALILFWCVNKYLGYYILSVGFIGTLSSQFMKLLFRVPRPWVVDSNFTILEQAREAASGYSFPSGHSQSAVGTFGGIAYMSKNRIVRSIAIVIAVLVPLSRMYIGVHTPLDVFVAAAMAVILIIALKPIVFNKNRSGFHILLAVMLLMAVAFLYYVEFYPFPADIDTHNLQSGLKNAYTLLGALLGLITVYAIDEKWVNFPTRAVWWVQVIKVVGGLLLVLAIKSGTKDILNMICGESVGRAIRYYLIVIVAGVVWPLTFKVLSGLHNRES